MQEALIMKKKKSGSRAAKRATLTVLCVMLGLVLVVMLGGTVYVEYLLNQMNYVNNSETQPYLSQEEADLLAKQETEKEDPDFTGPEMSDDDVQFADTDDIQIGGGKDIVNILLIGQDSRTATGQGRSDSIMLCTFNKAKKTITVTSFMRDMYVQIPGYKNNRINVAYMYGGMELLNDTLEKNFGLHIDGNVEINFKHFAKLIDLVGGIEVELSGAEANYINSEYTKGRVSAGKNLLNGNQALWYARTRKVSSEGQAGDFGRTNRQRIVMEILINKYKDSSLTELVGMLDDILPMITTDLSKSEITGYVMEFFPMLADVKIVNQRIPVEGSYDMVKIDNMSVLRVNFNKNIDVLMESLTDESVG